MKAFVKEQPHKYCDIINIGALQEPHIKQLQIRSAKTTFFHGKVLYFVILWAKNCIQVYDMGETEV